MTLEEQLADLKKGLETALDTKNKEQISIEIKAFEATAKGLFADEIKAMKDTLELDFKAQIKVVQDHADKLDVKLQANKIVTVGTKSFGQELKDAMESQFDEIEKFQRRESKSVIIELKAVGDFSTGNVTGGSRYGQISESGIIENPNRKVHIMDLMPGGNIGPGNTYTFMRENGVGEGAIAPTAEGATKSQFDFDLIEATVAVETIAGWMRVTRKAMQNIPGFIAFLQSRIPERFKKVLDSQVLYGNGTTPNFKGILTAGNFIASTAPLNTFLAEKITTDIAVLEDTYDRTATAVLLRPIDIATFYNNKAAGSGEYDMPSNVQFVGSQLFISGVPVFASTAPNAGDYVVGDFQMGAQLLTQNGMRIEFFEQDGTNVRENKVTVRVEGDYALPVYGPDFFIKGTTARA